LETIERMSACNYNRFAVESTPDNFFRFAFLSCAALNRSLATRGSKEDYNGLVNLNTKYGKMRGKE